MQIFWYSFDDLLIDAIIESMRLYWNVHECFWAHICKYIFFLSFSLSLCLLLMCTYTRNKKQTIWIEADKTGAKTKKFAQGHISLPISVKFRLFNGCVSFCFCFFFCKCDLSDRVRFAFVFFFLHSRGNLFWLLFLSFDYLLLFNFYTIGSTSLSITYTHKHMRARVRSKKRY